MFPSCPFSSTCVTPGISRHIHSEVEPCIYLWKDAWQVGILPLITQLILLWRMFFSLVWLHLRRKNRKRDERWKTSLKVKEPSLETCFRTETFPLLSTAETWDRKFEKRNLRGCMTKQSETKGVRTHSVYPSICRDQHGGYRDCLFQRDPSHWAKHVPYAVIFKGATGDLLVTKAITKDSTHTSKTPSTPKQGWRKPPVDEPAKIQIHTAAISNATTRKLCQKRGKCQ